VTTLLLHPQAFEAAEALVEGEAYRHLFRALRLEVGDRLRVVDGRGAAREATVARVDRRSGWLSLGVAAPALEAVRRVELWVGNPRPQRASWLVEKATEVGVSAVRFVDCERSVRGLSRGQLEHLEKVAVAALEQCGRARLPELSGPHAFAERLVAAPRLDALVYLDFDGERPSAAPLPSAAASVAFLIGPEGGWSPGERAALQAAGSRCWSLGERALRVETAALTAAALALLG
jgi:16S rRNA (uracil1498-N3)-methyltransferase